MYYLKIRGKKSKIFSSNWKTETGNWKIGKECQMKIQKTKMTVQTVFFSRKAKLIVHWADRFHSWVPPAARIPLLLIQMHCMESKVPAGS